MPSPPPRLPGTESCAAAADGLARSRIDLQLIADAPDGGNPRPAVPQLLAQADHVGVHRAVEPDVFIAPDALQKVLAAVGTPGLLGQQTEQVELLGRQVDGDLAAPHGAAGDIDAEAGDLQDVPSALTPACRLLHQINAPQEGAGARL